MGAALTRMYVRQTDRNEEANRQFSLFCRRKVKTSLSYRVVFCVSYETWYKGRYMFYEGKVYHRSAIRALVEGGVKV